MRRGLPVLSQWHAKGEMFCMLRSQAYLNKGISKTKTQVLLMVYITRFIFCFRSIVIGMITKIKESKLFQQRIAMEVNKNARSTTK